MVLPLAAPQRQLKHRRRIDMQVYERQDGLWEIDAQLTDVKTHDMALGGDVRPAGEPIHDVRLRLVVDDDFEVLEAGSHSERVPYPGHCDALDDTYRQFVGLNLLKGFRWAIAERVGGRLGCTHLTELAGVLPTAVIQARAGDPRFKNAEPAPGMPPKKPFQIDRCHALRSEGEVVRLHYSRWHAEAGDPPPADSGGSTHLSGN